MQDFVNMTPEMTRELNLIAKRYRKPYTELIDTLSDIYDDETGFWWDTPLASRNTHISWCFRDICVLRLILNCLSKSSPDAIVVSCEEIKQAVLHNAKEITIHAPDRGQYGLALHRKRSEDVFSQFQTKILEIQKYRRSKNLDTFRGRNLTLVGTYREAAETETGTLRDRYFPGLKENCDGDIVFLSTCGVKKRNETQLLDVIHDRDDHICVEDWIEEHDFTEIRRYIQWSQSMKSKKCFFDGMDVTVLIQSALYEGSWNLNTMYGIARGEALCRIIERHGLRPRRFFDWYEGQPSSNATIRRFRKKYPDVPTVACAPFAYGENQLGHYPSKQQVTKNIVPEYFSLMGKAWQNQTRQFCKDVKCVAMPSFRHTGLLRDEMELPFERRGVLLILPYFIDASSEILRVLGEAIKDMKPDSMEPIFIKNHPVNRDFRFSDYDVDGTLFQTVNTTWLDSDMNEAVRGKSVIILAKTTSTLECMLSGACIINYIPSGDLSMISLPEETMTKVSVAYTAKELRDCLKSRHRGLSKNESDELRKTALTPVNGKTVADFLQLRRI